MKNLRCWIIAFVAFAITASLIYTGYQYGERMHWIFEDIPFDMTVLDDENIIRIIHAQNTSNTITFTVTSIEETVVSDRIDTVIGFISGHEELTIEARMWDKDVIHIDPGDVISVTGTLDYDQSDQVLKIGCLIHGGAFSKYNPARFSKEYMEVVYGEER